jgi:hypothetical protein
MGKSSPRSALDAFVGVGRNEPDRVSGLTLVDGLPTVPAETLAELKPVLVVAEDDERQLAGSPWTATGT